MSNARNDSDDMTGEHVDSEARQAAALAHERINSVSDRLVHHETICSGRWEENRDSLKLIHERVTKTKSSLTKYIIGSLVTILAALLTAHFNALLQLVNQ